MTNYDHDELAIEALENHKLKSRLNFKNDFFESLEKTSLKIQSFPDFLSEAIRYLEKYKNDYVEICDEVEKIKLKKGNQK